MDAPAVETAPEPPLAEPATGLGFRTLLALVLLVLMGLAVAIILVSLGILRAQILGILPDTLVFEADTAFRMVLFSQAVILFVAAALFLLSIYVIIGELVARPLRRLTRAMEAYAIDGTRIELRNGAGVPREVRTLNNAFNGFIDRVEFAHKRDSDISRMKSDFISTAAHQFRTPLTGIRWALEALEKEQLTEDQHALVTSAVGKSKDLVGIVSTLLDISSIESGKYHYKFEPTDIRALAERIVHDFTELAAKRTVSLFFVGGEEEVIIPPVKADPERITWVLNNLVENAIRYTPAGGTVQIFLTTGGGRVYVHVKDTGIGIPKSDQSNIFERFYRAGNAVQKENAGNGLGLYIGRTIATDHGGDLSFAANESGVGTTFTLSLPLA